MSETREVYLRNMVGLLTEDDLITMLSISEHTTQGWRFYGNGPHFVKLGKRVYYRIKDVRDWIDGNVRAKTGKDEDDRGEAA